MADDVKSGELAPLVLDFASSRGKILDASKCPSFMHLKRRDDVVRLLPEGAIGIELGVAEGVFSERVLEHSEMAHLYAIDMYAGDRGHDVEQYKRALRRMQPFQGRHSLLRMRFHEAVDLFDDGFFDFIYVDGYAHTGEEDGMTFRQWWPKLKPGGLFAGDDYDPAWPMVMRNVDDFLIERGLTAYVIPYVEEIPFCKYPTWFTFKPR